MRILTTILALTVCASTARAVTLWDEAFQGDLSGNNLAPTALTLGLGVNTIKGTMGRDLPQDPVDRDIFTFTIAPGRALTSINVTVFTPTNQSFYAIAPGTSIDITDPAGTSRIHSCSTPATSFRKWRSVPTAAAPASPTRSVPAPTPRGSRNSLR